VPVRGDASRGSGYPSAGTGAAAAISLRKTSRARGNRVAAGNRKTSHNSQGKANRREFAPLYGEQNLVISK